MSTLAGAVDRVLAVTSQHQKMNETNTRVLLIEPLLDALGWDTRDLAIVTREVAVKADGTFIDYALLDSTGKASLYVEAKPLGARLTDPKVVSQTVNYANNDGVPWCVLTDGLRWRVFWTFAPVPMERKGVFDVDLSLLLDEHASPTEKADTLQQLGTLGRRAVEAGDLDNRGRSLFDSGAVRVVLEQLFTDPPEALVTLISERLDHPLDPDRVRLAVTRLGRPFLDAPTAAPPTAARTTKSPGASAQPQTRQTYTYADHFDGRAQAVVDLYQQFHEAVMARGDRIVRAFKKQCINYTIDGRHIFVSVVPQASNLKLYLALPGSRAATDADLRDVTRVGHWGSGNLEALLTPGTFEKRLALVDEAIAAKEAAGHPARST